MSSPVPAAADDAGAGHAAAPFSLPSAPAPPVPMHPASAPPGASPRGRSASVFVGRAGGEIGAVMPRPRPGAQHGAPRPSFSMADAVTSLLQAGGVSAASAAAAMNPLAALHARHRASVIAAAGGADLQSHAREVRRHGSVNAGSAQRHHLNLEQYQLAQLAAKEAWRTILHKDPGNRSSEEVVQLFNWLKSTLARPSAAPTTASTPVGFAAASAAPSPSQTPTSPFLQALPPLVLRGLCHDLALLYQDKGEVCRIGRTAGYGEGYFIVISGSVAVLEYDADARRSGSPSRSRSSRSPSPMHAHHSLENSPVPSAAATPLHSRSSSGAHTVPRRAGSAHPVPADDAHAVRPRSEPAADDQREQEDDSDADDEEADTIAPALISAHAARPASGNGLSARPSSGPSAAAPASAAAHSRRSSSITSIDDEDGSLNSKEAQKGIHLLGGPELLPLHSKIATDTQGRRWRTLQPGMGFGHASVLAECVNASRTRGGNKDVDESDTPRVNSPKGSTTRVLSPRSHSRSASSTSPHRAASQADAGRSTAATPADASPASVQTPTASSLRGGGASALDPAASSTGGLHGFISASHVKCLSPSSELLFIPRALFVQAIARTALGQLNRRIELLRQMFLFSRLSFEKLSKFCSGIKRVTVPAGSVLYTQGDPVDKVYFMQSGEVLLEYDARSGRSIVEKKPPRGHAEMIHVHSASSSSTGAGGGESHSAAAAGTDRQNVGLNVGAGPGCFSLTGENYLQIQAENASFRQSTRRRRGQATQQTYLRGTGASHSAAARRQRREADEEEKNEDDASTSSASEEEDTLVANAMQALNEGVGLGGNANASKLRAAPDMLSELSEELAPERKLMAALQAQIFAKRAGGAAGTDAARRAKLHAARMEKRMEQLKQHKKFKARPMPASFASGKLTAAEEEEQQLQLLAAAAAERRKAEARLSADSALAPPLDAAELAARASLHLTHAAAPSPSPPASTESGVRDMLAASKRTPKEGLMYKLRNLQMAQAAERAQRMKDMAEQQREELIEMKLEERARKEQDARFRRMIQANANTVQRGHAHMDAPRTSSALSAAHTHASYVALYPSCTYLGSLTPPTPKRGALRRPAVQFFRFFLKSPQALKLSVAFEELVDIHGVGSSSLVPASSSGAAVEAHQTGMFLSWGDAAVPTPLACAWRATADTAANAVANHPSSRATKKKQHLRRGLVQHFTLSVDPATDEAFSQPANQLLRETCWYFVSVQCNFACTFTLKMDLLHTSQQPSATAQAIPSPLPPPQPQLADVPPQLPTPSPADVSNGDAPVSILPAQPTVTSLASSLHRSRHVVPLALFTGARPTMFGDLELCASSSLDASPVRLTTARAVEDCVLFTMDKHALFEQLKGELWSRLQSLLKKQKKIYMQLIVAHAAVHFGPGGKSAAQQPSLYQRSMFVRAKLPDAVNLDPASAFPSATRAKNYRMRFAGLLGASTPAATAAASGVGEGAARGHAVHHTPTINYMFPAVATEDQSSEDDEQATAEDNDAAASSPRRPRTIDSAVLSPRRPRTPVVYNDRKTFFELFGLDSLNERLTSLLHERRAQQGNPQLKPLPFEVPNPASINEAKDDGKDAPAVLLSQAQEDKFHFRTHALTKAAAKRKRLRREQLLAQQRQMASAAHVGGQKATSAGEETPTRARSTSPATRASPRSASSSPSASPRIGLSALSWNQYEEFLLRDGLNVASELEGLSAEAMQVKLRAAEQVELELEEVIQEEDAAQEGERDSNSSSSSSSDHDGNDASTLHISYKDNGLIALDLSSPPASARSETVGGAQLFDPPSIHVHSPGPSPRLPGSSPQHFFLSHGHQLLYAGFGTPQARRLDLSVAPPPHSILAEKMHSRSSKSHQGLRFDEIYHVERESERKWLAASLRRQHILKALQVIKLMESSMHATAALTGIVSNTAKKIDLAHPQMNAPVAGAGSSSASTSPRKAQPAPPAAVQESKESSEQTLMFYPPSSSTQMGLSAKGSHILEAQLPHLASMVIAAEERVDPYGDDFLPSAAEQSMAAAAAAAAGLSVVAPSRRRIQGAPSFRTRPPVPPTSITSNPEACENLVNPELKLGGFRISKQAVDEAKQAAATSGSRPGTGVSLQKDTIDTAATTSRPGTAPFADTVRFPPQRYPPSAPAFAATIARELYGVQFDRTQPVQSQGAVSFRERAHSAKSTTRSMWPEPTTPLPVVFPSEESKMMEAEPMHIRPWQPHKELHSSQLAHCVPLPHPSALHATNLGGTFKVPRPAVRAGSATERARSQSARLKRRGAVPTGANTARASGDASSAKSTRPPSPSLNETGPFAVDSAEAKEEDRQDVDHADEPSSPRRRDTSSKRGSPKESSSRIGSPTRSPASSVARSPRGGENMPELTLPSAGDENTLTQNTPGFNVQAQESVSAWVEDPPSEPASRPVSAARVPKTRRKKAVAAGAKQPTAADPFLEDPLPGKRKFRPHVRSPTKQLDPDAIALLQAHRAKVQAEESIPSVKPAAKQTVVAADAQPALAVKLAVSPKDGLPFSVYFTGLDPEADTPTAPGNTLAPPPTHQRRPSSSPVRKSPGANESAAANTGADRPFSRVVRSRRSSRFYGYDSSGVALSQDIPGASPASSASGDDANAGEAADVLMLPDEVLQSNLFKPALDFRHGNRSASDSASEGSHVRATSIAGAPAAAPLKKSAHTKQLSVFSEAALHVFEPSSRWQLIDQLYAESASIDAHAVMSIPLTRVTSQHTLLDSEGHVLPDRPLPVLRTQKGETKLVQPRVHGPDSASDESDDDTDLSHLTREQKEERWAARIAKQEQRALEQQAEADRRAREAVEAELGDSDEDLDEEDGSGAVSERLRKRRERMARFTSLTLDEKVEAEKIDLDNEEKALEERLALVGGVQSPRAIPAVGLIHREIQAMRRQELEQKQRDLLASINGEGSPAQRRAAALRQMDMEQAGTSGSQPGSPKHARTASSDPGSPKHTRAASVVRISFENSGEGHSQPGSADEAVIAATSSHPPLASIPSGGVSGDRTRKPRGRHSRLKANHAARTKTALAHSTRVAVLSRAAKQLAATRPAAAPAEGLPLERLETQDAAGFGDVASAPAAVDGSFPASDALPVIPPLDLPMSASRVSTPAATARRRESTLLLPTGFSAHQHALNLSRPSSALHPALMHSEASVAAAPHPAWHQTRLERHMRRDALDSARRAENAARIVSAEQERLRAQQVEIATHAAAMALQKLPTMTLAQHSLSHRAPATALLSHAHLLNKSAHHPLQRLRMHMQLEETREERRALALAMRAQALAQQRTI